MFLVPWNTFMGPHAKLLSLTTPKKKYPGNQSEAESKFTRPIIFENLKQTHMLQ